MESARLNIIGTSGEASLFMTAILMASIMRDVIRAMGCYARGRYTRTAMREAALQGLLSKGAIMWEATILPALRIINIWALNFLASCMYICRLSFWRPLYWKNVFVYLHVRSVAFFAPLIMSSCAPFRMTPASPHSPVDGIAKPHIKITVARVIEMVRLSRLFKMYSLYFLNGRQLLDSSAMLEPFQVWKSEFRNDLG